MHAGQVTDSGPALVLDRVATAAVLARLDLRPAMAQALRAIAEERVSAPPRVVATAPEGVLAAMPAFVADGGLAAKLVTVFGAKGRTRHQGLVAVFDPVDGRLEGLLAAEPLTAARTAATALVALRAIAAPPRPVALIGTGALARAVLTRMDPPERAMVAVSGRTPANTAALAAEFGVVDGGADVERAVRDADAVLLATAADRPVVARDWLRPRAAVLSLGGSHAPEVDAELVRAAAVLVEWHGAWRLPHPAGALELQGLTPGRARLIGDLLNEPGRGVEGLTLFKSTGCAPLDVLAARTVLDGARAAEVGVEMTI